MKGVVKWFNDSRGYGFAEGEDGTDYFVHFTEIQSGDSFKSLKEGDEVEFTGSMGAKGKAAMKVYIVGTSS